MFGYHPGPLSRQPRACRRVRLGGCLAGAQGASGMHATVARASLLESSKKLPPASSGAHSQWTWCGGFRPEYTRVAQLARYDI
jgi:hypothetical protein